MTEKKKRDNSGWWGLLVLIGIGWWWLSRPPKKAPEPTSSALLVPAVILYADFQENEVAAEAKYTGKTVKVTGRAIKVEIALGDPQIQIAAGLGNYPYLVAEMSDTAKAGVAGIRSGDPIAVQCTCGRKLVYPSLKDCILVDP